MHATRGKIDSNALPDAGSTGAAEVGFAEPENELEEEIARVWREILRVDRVGIDHNFFDAGGSSLLVARLHHQLEELAQCQFSMVQLLQQET